MFKTKENTLFVQYENKWYRVGCLFDCIDKAMNLIEQYDGYVFIDQVGDYAVVGYEADTGLETI